LILASLDDKLLKLKTINSLDRIKINLEFTFVMDAYIQMESRDLIKGSHTANRLKLMMKLKQYWIKKKGL